MVSASDCTACETTSTMLVTSHLQLAQDWLRKRLAAVLRIDPQAIDPDLSLAAHGLDSLASIELQQDIQQHFDVEVSLEAILSGITLNVLSESLSRAEPRSCPPAYQDHVAENAPLSPQQQALWFEHHLDPSRASCNIARAVRILVPICPQTLRDAFQELVRRHDSLRLGFEAKDGMPVRKLRPSSEVRFAIDRSALAEDVLMYRLRREASLPFDLAEPPLLRAVLFVAATPPVLLVVTHHIVCDLWSLSLLSHELGVLLRSIPGRAASLPPAVPLKLQQTVSTPCVPEPRLLEYWLDRLAQAPALDLPTDRPRPSRRSFRGSGFLADESRAAAAVKQLATECETSPFTVLLALFYGFLHRWTGQTDLVVGSPISLRGGDDKGEAVDYRVNPLPLRMRLSHNMSTGEIVRSARGVVTGAVAHREMALGDLVNRVGAFRDASMAPLFNVMFTVHQAPRGTAPDVAAIAVGAPDTDVNLGPLLVQPIDLSPEVCAFDFTLALGMVDERIVMRWEYNPDLFDETTARSMARSFKVLLEAALSYPRVPIYRLPLLTPADSNRIASGWNSTAASYPGSSSIVDLIEQRAEHCPDDPAVVFEAQTVTYRELHARADAMAARLQRLGARAESPVGIMLDRSLEMVVAVLGVLKSGAMFVPIDPEHPAERLAFVFADTDPLIVLTNHTYAPKCASVRTLIVEEWGKAHERFDRHIDPAQGAYMIYTSGSTGQPKGVVNTHQGLLNRLQWMQSQYRLTPDDRVLQKTPLTFDVAVWELLWPLMVGACLVVASPGGHREPRYLRNVIEREKITTIHFVPSMLQIFHDQCPSGSLKSIKRLICSGEELSVDLARLCADRIDAELHNLYGPTEAAIDVSAWHCKPPIAGRVPIGRPIANIQLYILDFRMNLVPPGVPGELYIGGVGLARCYWKRPGLTAARFVPNPFDSTGGSRLYRTGDLARFLADGTIEFLGRIDHQVKLQGQRVELGEVEAALRSHADVRHTAWPFPCEQLAFGEAGS